jgi:phosphoribosylformylglycinamidine synthase
MEIWEVGPTPTSNFAGSTAQRVLHGELGGRPTAPDPAVAKLVITIAAELAHRVPVLHDVSDGGRAVAVAEICIASGVGAALTDNELGALFSEDPHRFIAVFEPGSVDLPPDMSRKLGTIGGSTLTLGSSIPIELANMTDIHREAIPRRMRG